MKLSKLFARSAVVLLLGIGLAAAGSAIPATASGHPGQHQPVFCKLADASGSPAYDPTGLCPQKDPRTGASVINWDQSLYVNYRDFTSYTPIADPRIFPKTDAGFDCVTEADGKVSCTRAVASAPFAGQNDCSLKQLKNIDSYACRGSVVEAYVSADEPCPGQADKKCNRVTIYYGQDSKGEPRYYTEAIERYEASGAAGVPWVVWRKNDGKGLGTVIGTTRGYLSTDSPSDSLAEPANTVSVSSTITPQEVTAEGGRADYSVTVRATTAGSTLVRLHVSGFGTAVEDSVPSGWEHFGAQSSDYITYLVPHMNAGDEATARLHFTVTSLSEGFVAADANGTTASSKVNVRPAAPVCTDPGTSDGKTVAAVGSQPTTLPGLLCHVQASTDLKAWTGSERGAGTFTIFANEIKYTPPTSTFIGDDTIYVYTVNGAGVASLPTPIHVRVGGAAVSANDEYTVAADSSLSVDAGHGLAANDLFASGREGWSVVVDSSPTSGTASVAADGSLRFDPETAFTGDVTLTYHLEGPAGATSEHASATIHVVSDEPPAAVIGQPYQFVLAAMQGASAKFEVTTGRLPAGLRVDQGSGTISGTPTKAGDYHFVVKVTGEGASELRTVDMTVSDPVTGGDM